jgi:hypothetical protein
MKIRAPTPWVLIDVRRVLHPVDAGGAGSTNPEYTTMGDFHALNLRVGTIVAAAPNAKARNRAYVPQVDHRQANTS